MAELPVVFLTLLIASLISLLVCEWQSRKLAASRLKVSTSVFLLGYTLSLAMSESLSEHLFIVVGISFGVLGDVLLLGHRKKWFLAGMTAFLLGHIAYIVAFLKFEFSYTEWLVTTALLLWISTFVFKWIAASISGVVRWGVLIYMMVLSVMCALALSIQADDQIALVGLGAVLFMLSDLFVAQHRFKTPKKYDRLVGLPLYYCGQLLIATSMVRFSF